MNVSGCSRNQLKKLSEHSCLLTSLVQTSFSLIDSCLGRDKLEDSLNRLREKSGFDFVLKGRGFSGAVSAAKSMAALASEVR